MSETLEQINHQLQKENVQLKRQVAILSAELDRAKAQLPQQEPDSIPLDQIPALVDDFFDYFSLDRKVATIKSYSLDLSYFYNFLAENNEPLTASSVNAYIAHLTETHSASSSNHKLSALRTFCKYLVDRDLLHDNPVPRGVQQKVQSQPPQNISDSALCSLLLAAHLTLGAAKPYTQDYYIALRDVAIMELLAMGIRPLDLRMLKLEDVDLATNSLLLERNTEFERSVKITDENARIILHNYCRTFPNLSKDASWLFQNKSQQQISDGNLRYIVDKYAKQAQIDGVVTPSMIYTTVTEKNKTQTLTRRFVQSPKNKRT